MLSIVIADDETGIIELCKMLIEYPNARVIGEAHNGLELLDKIAELHPNTVITDISMPGMTGLELIEEAQKTYPGINFIVMSGFTDFEYVQSALRFGVWDYLLKPLQKAELNHILKKLDGHLEDARQQAAMEESVRYNLRESLSMLREKYLHDVWQSGQALPVPEIDGTRVLASEGVAMQCLLFHISSRFAAQAPGSSDASALTQKAERALEHIAALENQFCREVCSISQGAMIVNLLSYPEDAAAGQSEDLIRKINETLRRFNNQNGLVFLTGASSLLLPGRPEDIPALLDQARTALKWRLERTDSAVIPYQPETALALERTPSLSTAGLAEAVADGQGERLEKLILSAWQKLEEQPRLPGARFRLLEEQIACLNQAFAGLSGGEERPARISAEEILSGGPEAEKLAQRLSGRAQAVLTDYQERSRLRESSTILQAKQYVADHFAEDVSLNQVAKHVCLSPAYFSTLFRTETGCGFVKYLQHVRVEHAKKLLKSSKMRIGDIARAVGYQDLKFFNKVFLSETSVTPSEYRKFHS